MKTTRYPHLPVKKVKAWGKIYEAYDVLHSEVLLKDSNNKVKTILYSTYLKKIGYKHSQAPDYNCWAKETKALMKHTKESKTLHIPSLLKEIKGIKMTEREQRQVNEDLELARDYTWNEAIDIAIKTIKNYIKTGK